MAIAAPKLAVPKRLCPQPWPGAPFSRGSLIGCFFWDIPRFASNSPMIPMIGFPEPYSAIKAV